MILLSSASGLSVFTHQMTNSCIHKPSLGFLSSEGRTRSCHSHRTQTGRWSKERKKERDGNLWIHAPYISYLITTEDATQPGIKTKKMLFGKCRYHIVHQKIRLLPCKYGQELNPNKRTKRH